MNNNHVPISVLCLNPALDVTYEVPKFLPDRKNYARATRFDPGGNGLNVARALFRLQMDCLLIAPLAGETGRLIARLASGQMAPPVFMEIQGESRVNGTVIVEDPPLQFEINGNGPALPKKVLERMKTLMAASARGGYAILTGSIPPGVPEDVYGEIAKELSGETRVIVDARASLLEKSLFASPFFLKPNRHELSDLTGMQIESAEEARQAAQKLRKQYGISWVCVSLGEEGALLSGEEGTWRLTAPKVKVSSTVGAGDAMVAALTAGFAMGRTPAEILKLAVSCGSGTAAMPGTELFDPQRLPATEEPEFMGH